MSLLESLIIVSEKAANIARICRQEEHLFALLIQQKECDESNPRFVQDFKTLADVLIQETVKHDVGNRFPELKNNINGEENNVFCNKLGQTICVKIQETLEGTTELLEIALNGNKIAAGLLAKEVHRNVLLSEINVFNENIPEDEVNFDYKQLGIWIDPIDSTSEYISGEEIIGENGIYISGLSCVTVLIGVFNKSTGLPIIGIVNQPFCKQTHEQRWRGCCYWGLTVENKSSTSNEDIARCTERTNIICISSSEDASIKNTLKRKGFTLMETAGAGYKILTVITGQADAYVLSKDTTFKWDTCGPQAILKSLGGDVLNFNDALKKSYRALEYRTENGQGVQSENKIVKYCNPGGIIAYRDDAVLKEIVVGFAS